MNLEPFVLTAEHASFTEAARHLGVTPTAVSKAVARLERQLGVRLLTRTSRRVELTPEGRIWLEHSRRALDVLQAGRLRLQEHLAPSGPVRITTSAILGALLVARLGDLIARHPSLDLTVTFTDAVQSVAAGEADLALRVGELSDSALLARRLFRTRWVCVASPAYLARVDSTDPSEHLGIPFVGPSGRPTPWPFPIPTALSLGDGNAIVAAALAGIGVARVFRFVVDDHLAAGRLQRLFVPYEAPGPALHLLCRPEDRRLPRIRSVFEHLVDALTP